MPKVGPVVTDAARAGARCRVTLDSGEKIMVRHDRSGPDGGLLSIEISRLMGFASDRIFACNVDSPAGQAVLTWLTRGAEPGSFAATPLGAAVELVKDAGTLAELRRTCAALMASR
jgi:hypothetical protein